jgi:murein DD-endopeptidase MepM/ murein hydrolase activator NlpD
MTIVDHGLSAGLVGFAVQPLFRRYLSKTGTVFLLMAGALLPDVDYLTRILGKTYYYNEIHDIFLSHRGFAHTLGGVVFFGILFLFLHLLFCGMPAKGEDEKSRRGPWIMASLLVAGGLIHLLEDFLGPNGPWKGLVLFYPFSKHRIATLSLYGWYDFFSIYLFLFFFAMALIREGQKRIQRVPEDRTDGFMVFLVVFPFLLLAVHLLLSPGYPENLGFKHAEAAWREYQSAILPGFLKSFSSRMQEGGMKLLFFTVPNLKAEGAAFFSLFLLAGIFLFFFLRMLVYFIAGTRGKTLPIRRPYRYFAAVLFLYLLPVFIAGSYYLSRIPAVSSGGAIPPSTGLDFPVGDRNGKGWNGLNEKGWYVASSFLHPFFHPGEDWNGRGGGNTDLGQPVYAVSEGTVVFARDNFRLGKIVMIAHRNPGGEIFYSVYMHLKDMEVAPGEGVKRRQKIGSVGRGYKDATYESAHLHFELRRSNMAGFPAIFWPALLMMPGFSLDREELGEWIGTHYLSPREFIRSHRTWNPAAGMSGALKKNHSLRKSAGVPVAFPLPPGDAERRSRHKTMDNR